MYVSKRLLLSVMFFWKKKDILLNIHINHHMYVLWNVWITQWRHKSIIRHPGEFSEGSDFRQLETLLNLKYQGLRISCQIIKSFYLWQFRSCRREESKVGNHRNVGTVRYMHDFRGVACQEKAPGTYEPLSLKDKLDFIREKRKGDREEVQEQWT